VWVAPKALARDSLRRICVRAPNWVGDMVMATPAFRSVREHFSKACVTLVVRASLADVVKGSVWFDRTIICRKEPGLPATDFVRCVGEIAGGRHELALIFPNSFSSALMFALAGVPRRVGYIRDARRALLSDPIARPSQGDKFCPTYMVDYYLGLCRSVGIRAAARETELHFSPTDARHARRIMANAGLVPQEPLFLIHPGASYGSAKKWAVESFAAVAESLAKEFDAQIALIAGPADRTAVKEVIAACSKRLFDLSACGIDLHLLKCVVAASELMVTTDSGPRHYGIALGVPTVCLMGPTDPRYSTSGRPHDRVVRAHVDCPPCQLKECPRDHRCMTQISPEMVLRECRLALDVARRSGHD